MVSLWLYQMYFEHTLILIYFVWLTCFSFLPLCTCYYWCVLYIYILWPIAKQVVLTHVNHSRLLISDGIHLILLNEIWEEREDQSSLINIMLSAKQGHIWNHFITSLVGRGAGSNPPSLTSLSHRCGYFVTGDTTKTKRIYSGISEAVEYARSMFSMDKPSRVPAGHIHL